MKNLFTGALIALLSATPALAEDDLEAGFAGALRGCEEWVLNPSSWVEGIDPFLSAMGLGNKVGLAEEVNEAALPPKQLRVGNHFWRINSTPEAGYILVVSDQLPMCHITGGGGSDLQPAVEKTLASSAFLDRWEKGDENSQGEMITTAFTNREEPSFSIFISRAKKAGQRLDRVQVLATAIIDLGN